MRLTDKLLGRYGTRPSRLHTADGRIISIAAVSEIPGLLHARVRRSTNASPWLTPSAINYLETIFKPDFHVLELGSGSSTPWLAQRVSAVISLEDDAAWSALVAQTLDEMLIRNVDLRPTPLESLLDVIQAMDDETFDVVIVDCNELRSGFRLECAAASRTKVKRGGFLVIDDIDRSEYRSGRSEFEDWPNENFRGLKPSPLMAVATAVYRRPLTSA